MADIKLSVPQVNFSYYQYSQRPSIKTTMDNIYSRYKNEIDTVSQLVHIPPDIITSFIFIESGGNANAISGAGAVGLMQLVPSAASDVLVLEKTKGRILSDGEKQILTQKLGNRFTNGIMKMRYLGDKVTVNGTASSVFITQNDLLDPLLNILIGCLYVGLLMDEHTEGGKLRMDKVVVRYNQGYFSNKAGKGLIGDEQTLLANLPTETKAYILKLLGVNGTLDIAQNQV